MMYAYSVALRSFATIGRFCMGGLITDISPYIMPLYAHYCYTLRTILYNIYPLVLCIYDI